MLRLFTRAVCLYSSRVFLSLVIAPLLSFSARRVDRPPPFFPGVLEA
jgi:hypothetical protein